jgi:hypothetical protein
MDPAMAGISYATAIAIGLPVFLISRRLLGSSWWRYTIGGLVIAWVPALAYAIHESISGLGMGFGSVAFMFATACGAIAGLAFWAVGIARRGGANAV